MQKSGGRHGGGCFPSFVVPRKEGRGSFSFSPSTLFSPAAELCTSHLRWAAAAAYVAPAKLFSQREERKVLYEL